jgi:hypothetical protein
MARSASALRTHSAVVFFIKDLAALYDFPQEPVAFLQAPLHVFGCANHDVNGKRRIKRFLDSEGLIDLVARGHDNQKIYIAVAIRLAVSVRAEKDDPVRLEVLGNALCEATDDGPANKSETVADAAPALGG